MGQESPKSPGDITQKKAPGSTGERTPSALPVVGTDPRRRAQLFNECTGRERQVFNVDDSTGKHVPVRGTVTKRIGLDGLEDIFESDMIIKRYRDEREKGLVAIRALRWPEFFSNAQTGRIEIPYECSPGMTTSLRIKIEDILIGSRINSREDLNIRLVPWNMERFGPKRIYFEPLPPGDANPRAMIGYRDTLSVNEHKVKISNNTSFFTILHELGHALGLFHEHTRPDRDSAIDMNWDNLREGSACAFKHWEGVSLKHGIFDIFSVMNYPPFQSGFAADPTKPLWTPTEESLRAHRCTYSDWERYWKRDLDAERTNGRIVLRNGSLNFAWGFSDGDVAALNEMYPLQQATT